MSPKCSRCDGEVEATHVEQIMSQPNTFAAFCSEHSSPLYGQRFQVTFTPDTTRLDLPQPGTRGQYDSGCDFGCISPLKYAEQGRDTDCLLLLCEQHSYGQPRFTFTSAECEKPTQRKPLSIRILRLPEDPLILDEEVLDLVDYLDNNI